MSNNPKPDLIYALLTMDSFNRGYGFAIDRLDAKGNIGKATILVARRQRRGWGAASRRAKGGRQGAG